MKIAVTGASGFVGRNVLPKLIENGNEVIVITRTPEKLTRMASKCRVVKMNLMEVSKTTYETIGRPDSLLHLAWDGLPNYRSPHHFEEQAPLAYNFIKQLVATGLSSVVVAGTCFEYGMQNGLLDEEMSVLPGNPYGFAKNSLRMQLEFLKNNFSFDLTWMRLFYLYGDGQLESSLFSQLKLAVARNESSFLMSGGEQIRDYLHISDAADYIAKLVSLRGDFGTVNICSGQPVSVRALVEDWKERYQWDIELTLGYYPYPDYEPLAFWGNRTKLDRILGRL